MRQLESNHRHSVDENDVCSCVATAKQLAERKEPFAAGALFYYFGDM